MNSLVCRPDRPDHPAAVMRGDDVRAASDSVAFADLIEPDLVGLEGSSRLTRLLSAQAAQLLRPMALRVPVCSFEAVCRAVQAELASASCFRRVDEPARAARRRRGCRWRS